MLSKYLLIAFLALAVFPQDFRKYPMYMAYLDSGYVRQYYDEKNRAFLRNFMRNFYFLTTQNISNAKIAHLAWKICAFL